MTGHRRPGFRARWFALAPASSRGMMIRMDRMERFDTIKRLNAPILEVDVIDTHRYGL